MNCRVRNCPYAAECLNKADAEFCAYHRMNVPDDYYDEFPVDTEIHHNNPDETWLLGEASSDPWE